MVLMNFNSHAHVERDHSLALRVCSTNNFNSHAHVERDEQTIMSDDFLDISTHTLTWSVTFIVCVRKKRFQFQLTRSRGAWRLCGTYSNGSDEFQLTRSRGAWPLFGTACLQYQQFQLTRSRGAWRTNDNVRWFFRHFNSHAHVERDTVRTAMGAVMTISTHTLTWSVTRYVHSSAPAARFQLTRSRGAWRLCLHSRKHFHLHFNSHAHVERDVAFLFYGGGTMNFNSHAHVERDRLCADLHQSPWDFNSHAHVERDTWCCVYLVLAQRDADLFFYLMGIGLILFTVRSQIAWHFHANLLGICGSLGVRWSKY